MLIGTPLQHYYPDDTCQDTAEYSRRAAISDWFAQMFITPPEKKLIHACRSAETRLFLTQIGATLEQPDLSRRLISILTGKPVDKVEHILGYQYVLLFDGIAGPASTPPYESFFTDKK